MSNLIKLLQEKEQFSNAETTIADYLLANFRTLPSMSTRQLAQATYSSSAAIVRFCQKLGFGGYTEFRVKFLAEMMRYIESPQHGELKVSDRDSVQAILNKVLTIEVEALKEANNMLEPAIFMRALHLLSKTTHIDFYAMDSKYGSG